MDDNTAVALEATVNTVVTGLTITTVAYFIIVVWWGGLVDAKTSKELARHETCYEEWSYNEAHQERWLKKDYCGTAEN